MIGIENGSWDDNPMWEWRKYHLLGMFTVRMIWSTQLPQPTNFIFYPNPFKVKFNSNQPVQS